VPPPSWSRLPVALSQALAWGGGILAAGGRVGAAAMGAPPGRSARRGSPGRRGTNAHLPVPWALDPPRPCAIVAGMDCSRILNALVKDAAGKVAEEICGDEPVLASSPMVCNTVLSRCLSLRHVSEESFRLELVAHFTAKPPMWIYHNVSMFSMKRVS